MTRGERKLPERDAAAVMFMTPWVKRLLVANVVIYLFSRVSPAVMSDFGFIPQLALLRPWTLVTYAFLHANFPHVLFNMLMLFFFGPRLEERLSSATFIWFYLVCSVGGAVLSFALSPGAMVVGASGAIFGVVVGFARYWPRENIYIWGILPVQARILAIFMVASSLIAGVMGAQERDCSFLRIWADWSRGGSSSGAGSAAATVAWSSQSCGARRLLRWRKATRFSAGRRSRGSVCTRSTGKSWKGC